MSFVRLENLNDFIQPGSSCIKPIEKKTGVVAKVKDISLSDCLACSGCITTAETVLVQQQNHEELFKVINESKSNAGTIIAVSLSLQAISSLAYKYSLSAQETAERISSFLISIGCHKVFDINLARHLALLESYDEFKHRRKQDSPLISSICPGWVCYTEKTNGELVIPHLSKVRSPQQITGALMKRYFQIKHNKSRSQVFHVTLMPCFDKKLEASRDDFKDSSNSQDVDCVLTPIEFEQILSDEGVSLIDFEPRKLDLLFEDLPEFNCPLTSHIGSASGGYAANLMLLELFEKSRESNAIKENIIHSATRNNDFLELSFKTDALGTELGESPNVGRFAIVNGFRNIQTIVQRLKRKALKYDYIEVMACPSGCINGGAQCKPNHGHDQITTIELSKRIYDKVSQLTIDLERSRAIMDRLAGQLELDKTQFHELLHTQFHAVPKMQALTVSW